MAIISSSRPNTSGGGGGGEQIRFKKDEFNQTAAWAAGGLTLALSLTPVDVDGITVWSQGLILHPDDYTFLTSPERIQIDFSGDPVADTEGGTWSFFVQYPYIL